MFTLSITTLYHYAECYNAECRYAKCQFTELHYVEFRSAHNRAFLFIIMLNVIKLSA